MDEINSQCDECGTDVPADAPLGLCPACLLKRAMAATTAGGAGGAGAGRSSAGGSSGGFDPPPVEQLVPLFPQLEILEFIGRGGMGAVYKARQPHLDRFVAVKILPTSIADDPAFAERFAREARSLARLNHANIVTVHDFGRAGGFFFFVMEFVDGLNLRHALLAKTLEPRQALAIVPQICDALQYAHDEGVVHRDIKPENVLLDKKGRVKIADFGLAKLLQKTPQNYTLTQTHVTMGTPHYMAPEQTERPLEVDHRADIYSLGVVFYEMLTGELPLGRFAAPSQKAHVDARLDEVVFKTLEKEPARRYQQASEVKTGVQQASGDAPPQARSRWWRSRPSRPVPVMPYGNPARYSRVALCGAAWAVFGITGPLLMLGSWVLIRQSAATVITPTPMPTAVAPGNPLRTRARVLSVPPPASGAPSPYGGAAAPAASGGGVGPMPSRSRASSYATLGRQTSTPRPTSAPARAGGGSGGGSAGRIPPTAPAVESNPEWPDYQEMIEAAESDAFADRAAARARAGTPNAPRPTVPAAGGGGYGGGGYGGGGTVTLRAAPAPAPPPAPWWSMLTPLKLLLLPLMLLAATSPFGTTVLGVVAISQIRRSSGRLYGMPLALFDTLLFPLLLLDTLIVGGVTVGLIGLVGGPVATVALAAFAALGIVLALLADVWIVRRAREAAESNQASGGTGSG